MTSSPISIEIIGQTNRGKSSLYNALLARNISITCEEANTTRDYIRFWGANFTLTDNMGLDAGHKLSDRILQANIILYVVNYEDINHIDDIDKGYFKQLRYHKVAFCLIVNKCDGKENDFPLWKTTGAQQVFFTSTKVNYGLKELRDFLKIDIGESNMIKKKAIAIVGGVNSGKSSLLNLITGYKRSKVSNVAATTRDVVAEEMGDYVFYDTAGFNKIDKRIEKIAISRTKELMKSADLCIIVVDVMVSFSQWNKWLWQVCEKEGKAILFLFNKSDLLKQAQINKKYLLQLWHIKSHIPYLFFSTLHRDGVPKLMDLIGEVLKSNEKQIPKSHMSYFIKNIQLPTNNNYISIAQRCTQPQTFDVYTKKPLKATYKQYLQNQMITFFKFKGIKPICIYKELQYEKDIS